MVKRGVLEFGPPVQHLDVSFPQLRTFSEAKIILDVPAREKQERAQTAKRVGL